MADSRPSIGLGRSLPLVLAAFMLLRTGAVGAKRTTSPAS